MKKLTQMLRGAGRTRVRAVLVLAAFLVFLAVGFFVNMNKVNAAAAWTSDYYFYVTIANAPEKATKVSKLKIYVRESDLGKMADTDHNERGISNTYTAKVRAVCVDKDDNPTTENPYGLYLVGTNGKAKTDYGEITVKRGLNLNSYPSEGEETKKDHAGEKVSKGYLYAILVDIPFVYTQPSWEYLDSANAAKRNDNRFSPYEYVWWNGPTGEKTWADMNTVERNVISEKDQTCHFTMQVNESNTAYGKSDPVHAEYEMIMTKPELNITYDANGGTWSDGSTADKSGGTVTYNGKHTTKNTSAVSKTGNHLDASNAWKTGSSIFKAKTAYTANTLKDVTGIRKSSVSVTLKANWQKNTCTVHYDGNGATGGSTVDSSHTYGDGSKFSENSFIRTGYKFTGWNTAADGSGTTYKATNTIGHTGWLDNDTGFTKTLYAQWKKVTYKISLDKQGGVGGASAYYEWYQIGNYSTSKCEAVISRLTIPAKTGYIFGGYYTGKNGSGIQYVKADGTITSAGTTFTEATTLYAKWTPAEYKIHFDGNDATGGSMTDMTCSYGISYKLNSNRFTRTGYHFREWNTEADGSGAPYADMAVVSNLTSVNGKTVILYAQWEANAYTLVFDPNEGAELTEISDIVAQYDAEITLPDAADSYVKYTLDGVNVTREVLSGNIRLSSLEAEEPEEDSETGKTEEEPEAETEKPEEENGYREQEEQEGIRNDTRINVRATAEDLEETEGGIAGTELTVEAEDELKAVSPSRPYPSVFMGWALEEGKDRFIPQWKAGDELPVSILADAAGVADQDGAEIRLYAVWDDCPWIEAKDLYYTLEQAQSGLITEEEILSHATASDREDGTPILPGFHDNGTSFSIPDYASTDFTTFQHEGSCTENLTVVDSVGSTYKKQITVYIVDTTPNPVVKRDGDYVYAGTRFINRKYYNATYEYGGLEENSIWKTEPEYRAALLQAFDNLDNDTPEETYYFTHEEILQMNEFIDQNGIGNTKYPDALQRFYAQFMQ